MRPADAALRFPRGKQGGSDDRICDMDRGKTAPSGGGADDPADALLRGNMQYFKKCGFCGSATVEFTKEDGGAEAAYENALKDMRYIKSL